MDEKTTPAAASEPPLERYNALLQVSEAIAAHRDLNTLFHDLAGRLHLVVEFDFLALILHDAARNVMRLHILESSVPSNVETGTEFPLDESPGGWAWKTQQPLIVSDLEVETRFPTVVNLLRDRGVKSFCTLPLTTAHRRVGALGFGSAHQGSYGESNLEFLQLLARQVAVAVDNALNSESAQSYQRQLALERDRLRLLLEINNAMVSSLELRELFAAIAASLRRVMQCEYIGLALYDAETDCLRLHTMDFPGGRGLIHEEMAVEVNGTPAGRAFVSRRPVLFTRVDLIGFASDTARRLAGEGLSSGVSLPLVSRDRVLGTLNVASLREGAFTQEDVDLLSQVANQVALAVENALAFRQIAELRDKIAEEKLYLEDEIRTEYNFEEIVGESASLKRVLKQVETVAPTDSTVLIQGDTGTGKELIARALHNLSSRRERTFVKLNCAAIPTGLLESELFGHEKGAFTGAIAQKTGRLELAHQGTLFLDEVGDIPLELQPKLLRVLQEKEFERLGSSRTLRVDARLVAATNRDLELLVAHGQFRSDLYYRLNVFPIIVPPLRERREDIPVLIRHFAQKYSRRMNKRIETIPAEAMEALTHYHWPGNIRELENLIERAVILSTGSTLRVSLSDLKTAPGHARSSVKTLESVEREHILRALREANWVIGGPRGAAARLGVKRTTLQARIRKLGISRKSG